MSIQVDEMKKKAILVAKKKKNHNHTSLLSFHQMNSKCLVLLMIFFAFYPKFTSLINITLNLRFVSSMCLPLRIIETMQELALRLLFCVIAEFSQGDVGTLLVLTPLRGTL